MDYRAVMTFPDYSKAKAKCLEFLRDFTVEVMDHTKSYKTVPKYMNMLNKMKDPATPRHERIVEIEVDDIMEFDEEGDLASAVSCNTHRYVTLFSEAIDELVGQQEPLVDSEDVFDVLAAHRLQQAAATDEEGKVNVSDFPPQLLRRYEVRIVPSVEDKVRGLREVKAENIGQLLKVKGIVVRAADVKPRIAVATYTCDACGNEIYQEVPGKQYLPLTRCTSRHCQESGTDGKLQPQPRGAKFVKYQEIKMQELPEQVPVGHVPRSMLIVARGELTRAVLPGDIITVGGIYTPMPFTGFKAIKAGLIADTMLQATSFELMKKSHEAAAEDVPQELREQIMDLQASSTNLLDTLSKSLAPEIFGHEDVKKSLLIQLIGGVTRAQNDGMRIRGDINICLMGDPGVAKSQLLKHVSQVAPRCVYTTGKGSSGVGLTAAVIKDPVSGEMALEGGALVLADKGICCIDEFDKMDESDRTAIHEVMEQQTVSIAKAGITTTLNARTSILAAANPLYGRYNPRLDKNPHAAMLKNINLPAALLSRFDLMFILRDHVDSEHDVALARHVTLVHMTGKSEAYRHDTDVVGGSDAAPDSDLRSIEFLRAYIALARTLSPFIPRELANYIAEDYVRLRKEDQEQGALSGNRGVLTPRQLLSILRMSQACARIRGQRMVGREDVDEAIRLIKVSKQSITNTSSREVMDPISRIYDIMCDRSVQADKSEDSIDHLKTAVLRKGFTEEQFEETINQYAELGLIDINAARTKITWM